MTTYARASDCAIAAQSPVASTASRQWSGRAYVRVTEVALDPSQSRLEPTEAFLEAALEGLRLHFEALLLRHGDSAGHDEGHARSDPAKDRNAGNHHYGGDETGPPS